MKSEKGRETGLLAQEALNIEAILHSVGQLDGQDAQLESNFSLLESAIVKLKTLHRQSQKKMYSEEQMKNVSKQISLLTTKYDKLLSYLVGEQQQLTVLMSENTKLK